MKIHLSIGLMMLIVFCVVLSACSANSTNQTSSPGATSASTSASTSRVLPTTTHGLGPIAYAITAGLDGNLWFTEADENKICKISPSTGEITEYHIPTADARPWGITVGPDGNLWFTETDGNNIGKISLKTGVITEYTLPTADSSPQDISHGFLDILMEATKEAIFELVQEQLNTKLDKPKT